MSFCLENHFTAKTFEIAINLPFKVTFSNKIFRCQSYVLSRAATWIKRSRKD